MKRRTEVRHLRRLIFSGMLSLSQLELQGSLHVGEFNARLALLRDALPQLHELPIRKSR